MIFCEHVDSIYQYEVHVIKNYISRLVMLDDELHIIIAASEFYAIR